MKDEHITIISSLPVLRSPFEVSIAPISRYQLERYLSSLSPREATVLRQIEDLLHWDHLNVSLDNDALISMAEKLIPEIAEGDLLETILSRLDMRTIVAALRHKQRGDEIPSSQLSWGYGRYFEHIKRHWQKQQFGLQHRYPWIIDVEAALSDSDPLAVERHLLITAWRQLSLVAQIHHYDFTAIVAYVLRWNIVARWTSYDHDRGLQQFRSLLAMQIEQQESLFAS